MARDISTSLVSGFYINIKDWIIIRQYTRYQVDYWTRSIGTK